MTAPARRGAAASAAAGLGALAALAAACGSSAAPAPKTTVTVTASPSSPSGSTATAATPTAPPSGGGGGAAPACPTRSLEVKLGPAQGTAGSTYVALDFVNISSVTCTLYGYPGVSLAGGSPVTQIGRAAQENHQSSRQLVTLAPNAAANALLRIVDAANFPAATCHLVTAHYLQVFPPNQTTPVYVASTTQACAKPVPLLTVSAVRPGAGSAS